MLPLHQLADAAAQLGVGHVHAVGFEAIEDDVGVGGAGHGAQVVDRKAPSMPLTSPSSQCRRLFTESSDVTMGS